MFKLKCCRKNFGVLVTCSLALAPFAAGGERGVFEGPAGSNELRAGKDAAAAVVASVQPGEPFFFEAEEEGEWGKITLASGPSGWLRLGEIRLFFDRGDLPKKDPVGTSEIDEAARRRGFDYVKVTRLASQGDPKALRQFFTLAQEADGAAAESIAGVPIAVYHILGDAKLARFLAAQSTAEQLKVRNIIVGSGGLGPPARYLQRHFPETSAVLFPAEFVAWPSPDGRFAIRKVFSDAADLRGASVVRAELIEKKTGRVLLDMTADDIGKGADREGESVWSPDSKRLASRSSDLTQHAGNMFDDPPPPPQRKRTVVYQLMGDSWGRVELPLDRVPGREKDAKLAGAVLGHDYIEPVRWQKPNVLVLERHEYYRNRKPVTHGKETFQSIVDVARWHRITATFSPEGKATLVWKVLSDR